jgi:hypothetical protein
MEKIIKKFIAVLNVSALALCILSCSYRGTYDDGYEVGYVDGYSDAEAEMQYNIKGEFTKGYDSGWDDGNEEVYNAIEDAKEYARSQTGWSVYEAWNNIRIYNDGVDPFGHDLPTEEEYQQSVETLVLFCEYLDSVDFY